MPVERSAEVVQKEIEALFAELAEIPPVDLTEGEIVELVQRSQRIRSMADGHCVRAAGALECTQAWVGDGARSTTAWMAWRYGPSKVIDVPAERCEVDHVVRYTDGGLTVQDNGRCRCKHHHRRARPPT